MIKPSGAGTGDRFEVQDETGTSEFIVKDGGNVGIGTTAPSNILHIVSNSFPLIQRNISSTSGHTNNLLSLKTKTSGDMGTVFGGAIYWQIEDSAGTSNDVATIAGFRDWSDTLGALAFATYNGGLIERMTIDSDGNVAIGDSTSTVNVGIGVGAGEPSEKLVVVGGISVNTTSGAKESMFHIDDTSWNVTIAGNLSIGSTSRPANITMYSPNGNQWRCGPDNNGVWGCSN